MSKYGVPYQGSKAQIAEDIINELPSGNRFVDLFGGGPHQDRLRVIPQEHLTFKRAKFPLRLIHTESRDRPAHPDVRKNDGIRHQLPGAIFLGCNSSS